MGQIAEIGGHQRRRGQQCHDSGLMGDATGNGALGHVHCPLGLESGGERETIVVSAAPKTLGAAIFEIEIGAGKTRLRARAEPDACSVGSALRRGLLENCRLVQRHAAIGAKQIGRDQQGGVRRIRLRQASALLRRKLRQAKGQHRGCGEGKQQFAPNMKPSSPCLAPGP